jgi:hypothetical protein
MKENSLSFFCFYVLFLCVKYTGNLLFVYLYFTIMTM